jgi:hypothetical protein
MHKKKHTKKKKGGKKKKVKKTPKDMTETPKKNSMPKRTEAKK